MPMARLVSIDVTARAPRARRALSLAVPRETPAALLLAGLVAASFVVRLVAASGRVTPSYLPDEYLYRALADGLASSGLPTVRGTVLHFPALLQPLLTAPFWLQHDAVLAFELTQGLNALAMSLAAVPVFALARRLELGPTLSLGAAALAISAPSLRYASFVLADPIAYPLALAAVYAGVCALARPTSRGQLAFLTLAGLATFARVQYAVLPLAFLAAAFFLEGARVDRVVRSLRLTLALCAAPLALLLVLGGSSVLGPYSGVAHVAVDPSATLHWAARDAMLLAYSAGWVIVPGALLGLALALARPESPVERAFGALTLALSLGLLLEAALVADFDSDRFQERYLMLVPPLLGLAFALWARRGARGAWPVALLAAGAIVLSARVPLVGYTLGHGNDDSPTLSAVLRLEQLVGLGTGSLVVALAAAALSAIAAATGRFRRGGPSTALVLAVVATALLGLGAASFDATNSRRIRATNFPGDVQWVDHTGQESVALLQTPGADGARALHQIFWNRSVSQVLLLPGASAIDPFGSRRAKVGRDGTVTVGGRQLRRPFLVQTHDGSVALTGAARVAQGRSFDLWSPRGTPRLELLTTGRYSDRWLAGVGRITAWPDPGQRLRGVLRLEVWLPPGGRPTPLRFTGPRIDRRVVLRPGAHRSISICAASDGPWTLRFRTYRPRIVSGFRVVSVKASVPVLDTHKASRLGCR